MPLPQLGCPEGLKVLVVDDDEAIRETVMEILEDAGYAVATAVDGREALAFVANERPCLILLDLMMPVMNGWQVVDHMQSDDRLREIPVCVVTAMPHLAPAANVRVLAKPIRLEKLLAIVEERCSHQLDS